MLFDGLAGNRFIASASASRKEQRLGRLSIINGAVYRNWIRRYDEGYAPTGNEKIERHSCEKFSLNDLARKLMRYIRHHNQHPAHQMDLPRLLAQNHPYLRFSCYSH